ncbi:nitroreductase/quinone reductase family protein [Mycobacterium sp.]|uniref:nitroreductase/quinone reductase family protein n=1 Tax=Mycobacterium sp. TaxID=1785 RepID=UPI003BA866D0
MVSVPNRLRSPPRPRRNNHQRPHSPNIAGARTTTGPYNPQPANRPAAEPDARMLTAERNWPCLLHRHLDAAEEHRFYWPQFLRMYPQYHGYQEATNRVIPLVICEPYDLAS